MRGFLLAILLILSSQSVLALPEGDWVGEYEDGLVVISISAQAFKMRATFGDEVMSLEGPVADVREPEGGQPGRLIVGPIDDDSKAYDVYWFLVPKDDRIQLDVSRQRAESKSDAEQIPLEYEAEEMTVMLSSSLYEQTKDYPLLPELSREALLALLQEALDLKASSGDVFVLVMQNLMLEKGYHPVRSGASFGQALDLYGDTPEVKELLSKLGMGE